MAPTTYCPARWLTVRSGGLPGRDTNCRISRPAVGARLSRSEPPRPSTALFAEVARAPASRRSASALAHATPRSPRGRLRDIAADKFFPIIGIRAMVNRGRVRRRASGRSSRPRRRKNWRKRDSGSTDRQPLDFPRNGRFPPHADRQSRAARVRPPFSYAAIDSGDGRRLAMSMTPIRRPSIAMTPRRNSLAVSAAMSGVGWIWSSPAVKMSETPSTSRPAT